jgi:phage baseplate assembly protein V
MTAQLRDAIVDLAQQAAAAFMPARFGIVTSYDPDNYAVKVELQPEGVETGWCPIKTALAGNGFGMYAGPAKGDQAAMIFQEGDALVGICIGFLPSDEDRPPSVPSGEIHAIHKSGAFLKFTNDGKVTLETEAGFFINADTTIVGNVDITGDTTVSGDVLAGGEVEDGVGKLSDLRDAYNDHKHTGVQAGGATSGGTDTPV